MQTMKKQKGLVLFNYDWDVVGFERAARKLNLPAPDSDGFDLFSFPSNAHLAWFDMDRFVHKLAGQAKAAGWTHVASNHEQFGALAAALLAEKMGWPGTSVNAVLACQHKLYARQVLDRVAPEANIGYRLLDTRYGGAIPEGLHYPQFVKPVKAAFSVLARTVQNRQELHDHTRFGGWELWVIKHLVEPFERVFQRRMGPNTNPQGSGSAHRLMVEDIVNAPQFNLDGYVWQGKAQAVGVVDAIMYPGTQAFMRWDYPSVLAPTVQERALEVAQKFLTEVGFDHGLFNMEFFYDAATNKLSVIEFNPRMASQFSDLYLRVDGIDLHSCALALAQGQHPFTVPRTVPTAGAASSLVYRSFVPGADVPMPATAQVKAFEAAFADGLLFSFPKDKGSTARDFKWLGSYRYGIVHLGGKDAADLHRRADAASQLLGWPSPYLDPSVRHAPAQIAVPDAKGAKLGGGHSHHRLFPNPLSNPLASITPASLLETSKS